MSQDTTDFKKDTLLWNFMQVFLGVTTSIQFSDSSNFYLKSRTALCKTKLNDFEKMQKCL